MHLQEVCENWTKGPKALDRWQFFLLTCEVAFLQGPCLLGFHHHQSRWHCPFHSLLFQAKGLLCHFSIEEMSRMIPLSISQNLDYEFCLVCRARGERNLRYIEVPLYFGWFLLVKKLPTRGIQIKNKNKTLMHERSFLASYLTCSIWILTYFNKLLTIWNTEMNAISKEKSISLTDWWRALHVGLACIADELNPGIYMSFFCNAG